MVGTGDEEHIIFRVIPGTDPLQDFEEDDPSQLIVIDDDTDDSSDADDLSEVSMVSAGSIGKQEFQALLSDVAAQHQRMAASLDALASRVEDMSVGQVEETAVRVVSESGHVRGLTEITNVFDKSEVALILACSVRRYQEYQALKGKREDKDIISYRQLQKKFGTNKRTLMEVVQGYKYRYPGGVIYESAIHNKAGGGRRSPSHKPNGLSERPQHNISPYGTTTNFSVLSGPPNPPKVEIYLRKTIRRHLG